MCRKRGRIVLVGSTAGIVYSPGNVYGATKWAVTGLAENTRRMVTGEGVGVTLINPGATETNFFDADGGKDLAAEVREYYIPDFSNWKDHDSFESEFAKLLRDLRATGK